MKAPSTVAVPATISASHRFQIYAVLAIATTLFLLIAILKPALEARSQAALREVRQLNGETPVVIPVTPAPVPAPGPEPPAGAVPRSASEDLASQGDSVSVRVPTPMSVSPETVETASVTPPGLDGQAVPGDVPVDVPESAGPVPPLPPVPAPVPLTPRELVEQRLGVPLVGYSVDDPIPLQDLLYDFEEILGCSVLTSHLPEPLQTRLTQPIAPLSLSDTTIQQTLTDLLARAGLTFRLSDEGDLIVQPLP